MSDHPNAARYRELNDAMQAGDMSQMVDFITEDVEWWEIGSTEPIRGKAALMARMGDLADFDISGDLHDVVSNDDHMIALVTATATRGDETFTYRTAEIYHVDTDGQVTHRWAFSDDTERIKAFFG
jgi:ketosteroid isomerase-like protein